MIDTLVLSGGGVKIVYYIGLLKFLEDNNLLENIHTYIGCSSGAIFSLLMSMEFKSDELLKIFENIKFNNSVEFDFINFFENFGLSNTDFIINIISIIIKNKYNISDCDDFTFKYLYDKNNKKLIINGSNITDNKCDIFSYKDTPNMKILDAIRISINIPFFFKKIEYNNKLYVDGALFYHYPIKYTKNIKNTLGVYITMKLNNNNNEFINYLSSIINLMYDKELFFMEKKYKKNTIIIKSEFSPLDFNLNKDNIDKCVNSGYNLTLNFFQKHSTFKKLITSSNVLSPL